MFRLLDATLVSKMGCGDLRYVRKKAKSGKLSIPERIKV